MSVTCSIFNVQHYSIHDGPGIRSTVFVKGCPLRCRWCQNPESQRAETQLMFYDQLCTRCGGCAASCSAITLTDGKALTDRTACRNCGRCVEVCPHKARELAGKQTTAAEVLRQILPYKLFLAESGGGVTVSGGEPMLYPAFVSELFALCHEAGLHTAFESSAFASREAVDAVCHDVDLAICDIKHLDSAQHALWTGVPNEQILANIRYIRQVLDKPMWIRVPVIPGVNADAENIQATAEFIRNELGSETQLQLLPYHALGASKSESLGQNYAMAETQPPTDETMQALLRLCLNAGVQTRIGG